VIPASRQAKKFFSRRTRCITLLPCLLTGPLAGAISSLAGFPILVVRITRECFPQSEVGDVIRTAIDRSCVVVEQFADGLIQQQRTLGRSLDKWPWFFPPKWIYRLEFSARPKPWVQDLCTTTREVKRMVTFGAVKLPGEILFTLYSLLS